MKQNFETVFRPNYEAYQASVWAGCGTVSSFLLMFWLKLNFLATASLTGIFYLIAIYYIVFARRHVERLRRISSQTVDFMSLTELEKYVRKDSMFLGTGFDWSGAMAQQVSDLYEDVDQLDLIRSQGKGATYLHGLGAKKEAPIFLLDDESKGHVLIVGTTGAGKTRLFDLLVSQSVLRGEATIVIDPKGDHELKENTRMAYERCGRSADFSFFHPAFLDETCALDLLANYQRESELASRIASLIPSDGQGAVFQSYSQNALMSVFYGIISGGRTPTILDVHAPLTLGAGEITYNAILRWSKSVSDNLYGQIKAYDGKGKDSEAIAKNAVRFYKAHVAAHEGDRDSDLDPLIGLFEHDSTHFSKMVASLIPVIGQLCAGPLKMLLSPDKELGRLPPSRKVVELSEVIRDRKGLYVGLDTLSDEIVGSRIGQLLLADLTAIAGARYNFSDTRGTYVNIFIDEASEVVTDKLIQLLNKGRGAGFRLFLATQVLADFEARSGSKAYAEMMTGNMNSVIMLRTINPATQEALSLQLPEVPISFIMKTASTSLSDSAGDGAFGVSHGERLMRELKPMIAPQTFGDLTDLEYFLKTPRGRIMKGKLPILEAPDTPKGNTPHYDLSMKAQLQGSTSRSLSRGFQPSVPVSLSDDPDTSGARYMTSSDPFRRRHSGRPDSTAWMLGPDIAPRVIPVRPGFFGKSVDI